jgi:hypothetical protein
VPITGTASANTYVSNPTLYYVVGSSITTNTFTVATSIANAKAGIAVSISTAGSGTHTAFANALACAGCVGEYIWNFVDFTNSVALVDSSPGQVANSISIPAGIWVVGVRGGVVRKTRALPFSSICTSGLSTDRCIAEKCVLELWA